MKSYPELRYEKKESISSKILICVNCGSDKTYRLGGDFCCGNCGLCEYVGRSDWMPLPDLIPDVIPKEKQPSGPPGEMDMEFEEEDELSWKVVWHYTESKFLQK